MQGCGSVFISSGSGSRILGYIPIRIQYGSGSRDLMTKKGLNKKYSWIKNLILDQKLQFTLSIKNGQVTEEAFSSPKRPSNTSEHELFKNISNFVGHFCPPGSGFGSGFRFRIHWPDWIRIRNPAFMCFIFTSLKPYLRPRFRCFAFSFFELWFPVFNYWSFLDNMFFFSTFSLRLRSLPGDGQCPKTLYFSLKKLVHLV